MAFEPTKPVQTDALLHLAAEEAASTGCFQANIQGEVLVARVSRLESERLSADWVDALPENLRAIWPSLSVDAQLAAFVVAANATSGPNWMDFDTLR